MENDSPRPETFRERIARKQREAELRKALGIDKPRAQHQAEDEPEIAGLAPISKWPGATPGFPARKGDPPNHDATDVLNKLREERQLANDAAFYGFSAVKKVYDPETGEVRSERVSPHDITPSLPVVPRVVFHVTTAQRIAMLMDFEREVEICMCGYVIMGDTPEATQVRNDAIQSGEHRRECPAWIYTWRRRLAASFAVELRDDE